MPKNSVIIDYRRDADDEISIFAQSVYTALNPNEHFIWEENIMPRFQANVTEYRELLEKALNGNASDVLKKNVSKSSLVELLHYIGTEVNIQSNNDLIKLQSSGFRMAKGRSKVGMLPKPTNFTIKSGDNSGDLLCNVDANPNASVYIFFSAPVPAPVNIVEWRQTISTTRKRNISGFIPGKQYEFKCAYQGTEPTLVYSNSIFIYAQ